MSTKSFSVHSVSHSVLNKGEEGIDINKTIFWQSNRYFLIDYLVETSQTLLEVLLLYLSIVIATLIE